MRQGCILLLLFCIVFVSRGQSTGFGGGIRLSKKQVDDLVKCMDSSFDPDLTDYVIDNFPKTAIEVDSILSSWSIGNLLDIVYLHKVQNAITKYRGTVSLISKRQMEPNVIQECLNMAKKNFKRKSLHRMPLLFINDKLIQKRAVKIVKSLKWKEIYCVSVIEDSNFNSYFGYLAKRGVIRVWTKK